MFVQCTMRTDDKVKQGANTIYIQDHLAGPSGNSRATIPLFLTPDMSQFRNCWNARDKIFGILGICDGVSIQEFKVDYSKDVKDIFRDLTQYLIQKDQNKWMAPTVA